MLITGGARSGKSQYAVGILERNFRSPCLIATAEARDQEMAERIRKHKLSRPNWWHVIEEPIRLIDALNSVPKESDVVLIDCLTLWLSNLLMGHSEEDIMTELESFSTAVEVYPRDIIIVSNEVGLGIVPDNSLARKFRDMAGTLNQKVAKVCDSVVFVLSGIPLKVK